MTLKGMKKDLKTNISSIFVFKIDSPVKRNKQLKSKSCTPWSQFWRETEELCSQFLREKEEVWSQFWGETEEFLPFPSRTTTCLAFLVEDNQIYPNRNKTGRSCGGKWKKLFHFPSQLRTNLFLFPLELRPNFFLFPPELRPRSTRF